MRKLTAMLVGLMIVGYAGVAAHADDPMVYDLRMQRGKIVDGMWVEFSGRATMRDPLGGRYKGDFRKGMMHGHGTYYFSNGDTCEGEWRKGKLQGKGVGWKAGGGYWRKCYQVGTTMKFSD